MIPDKRQPLLFYRSATSPWLISTIHCWLLRDTGKRTGRERLRDEVWIYGLYPREALKFVIYGSMIRVYVCVQSAWRFAYRVPRYNFSYAIIRVKLEYNKSVTHTSIQRERGGGEEARDKIVSRFFKTKTAFVPIRVSSLRRISLTMKNFTVKVDPVNVKPRTIQLRGTYNQTRNRITDNGRNSSHDRSQTFV